MIKGEWIRTKIPKNWGVARIKDHAAVTNGYPFDSRLFSESSGYPLVRIRDIQNDRTVLRYEGEWIAEAAISREDILVGMDGDFNVARWRGEDALLNQRVCCIRTKESIDSGYLFYMLPTPLKLINEFTYSTTVKHLSSLDVLDIQLPFPRIETQRLIANYLDHETTHIDALIAEKGRMLALLEEKRAALISEAVTRGLDPDVPLKPSGPDWLGHVAGDDGANGLAGLETRRLKYTATINDESLPETTDPDYELQYIDIGNVDSQGIIHDIVSYRFETAPSRARRMVIDGDVIVSTVRTYLQAIAPIEDPPDNLIVSTGFAVVRSLNTLLDREFCKYALREKHFLCEVESYSTGVSYPAINSSELGNIHISLPSLNVQRAIAKYLDRETAHIDALVAEIERTLALLEEKRSALITAAVTGQLTLEDMAS